MIMTHVLISQKLANVEAALPHELILVANDQISKVYVSFTGTDIKEQILTEQLNIR